MQKDKRSSVIGLALSLLLLGAVGLAWLKRDALFHMWRLYRYEPSATIVRIADETRMTSSARRLFYVYHPSLEGKQTFNTHCTDSEQTIVLGCYVARRGIYLYDITDDRLRGVEEVTAAHEMLHAAYDRLASAERRRIDALTDQAFRALHDERITATIEQYRKRDASSVPNELHSILATEVKSLPTELEQYYARYFSDRSAIVALSEQYEHEFTGRQQQREAYDAQLQTLKQQIDALNTELSGRAAAINQQYRDLTNLKQSGDIDAYNAGVPNYNRAVNAYNGDVTNVQAMIRQYNDIVEKRNALVLEESQLQEAIDSRPETLQGQ